MLASVSHLLLVGVPLPGVGPSARSPQGSHPRLPGGRRRRRDPSLAGARLLGPAAGKAGEAHASPAVPTPQALTHGSAGGGGGVLSVPMETAPRCGRVLKPLLFPRRSKEEAAAPGPVPRPPPGGKALASGSRIFCLGPRGHSARAGLASPRNPGRP